MLRVALLVDILFLEVSPWKLHFLSSCERFVAQVEAGRLYGDDASYPSWFQVEIGDRRRESIEPRNGKLDHKSPRTLLAHLAH